MEGTSNTARDNQGDTQQFNQDIGNILGQHNKGDNQLEGERLGQHNEGDNQLEGERVENKSKAGRGRTGRGRGRGKRGRGGKKASETRQTAKSKASTSKENQSGDEDDEEDEEEGRGEGEGEAEAEGEKEDEGKERKEEEKSEEEGEDYAEEEVIELGDEGAFVEENPHVDREHERYVAELLKCYRKGNTGRFQLLQGAYYDWCTRIGSHPRALQLLDCSSDEEEVSKESEKKKRKAKEIEAEKPTKVGKKINPGQVLTHQLVELSAFWDSKMRACFGYVPLTIFVPAWLLADQAHMSNRKRQSTSCLDVLQYVGLRVPSEWRQSFLQWSTSFSLCVQYWRSKYDREDVALRLEEHYKIVLAMKAKLHDAWAPALRYDITHRRNVWSHTLPDGSLSDVGVKNEDLAEQAITDSKANEDHRYYDNPYIIGGALENTCPWTGKHQPGWDMIGTGSDEQITAISGGRMLSHLAPRVEINYSSLYQAKGRQPIHSQPHFQSTSDNFIYRGRGNGNRGRGSSNRGGGPSWKINTNPTVLTTFNGVTVPKFGPGAFEALKAAGWKQHQKSGGSSSVAENTGTK